MANGHVHKYRHDVCQSWPSSHSLLDVIVKLKVETVRFIYASAPLGGANAYMFYRCFFLFFFVFVFVFFVFVFFFVRKKYETTVLGNG